MVIGKIAKIAIALATVGGAIGAGYALNIKESPKDLIARKVSWVNDWARDNGGCKLKLVWKRDGGYIYTPDHDVWTSKIGSSDKDYLDELRESLEGNSEKAVENKKNCKEANKGELRLQRNTGVGWYKSS